MKPRRHPAVVAGAHASRLCRAFMQKCVLPPWWFRRVFTTMLTPRSHDVHTVFRQARTRSRLRGTHVAFSFPTYCIERPRASTCAPRKGVPVGHPAMT